MYCWEAIELQNKNRSLAEYRVWNENSLRSSPDQMSREILEKGIVVRFKPNGLGVVLEYRGQYPGTFTDDILNLDSGSTRKS